MPDRPGFLRRFFLGVWRLLDFSRRLVLNVLFMVIVVVLLIAWFSSDKPRALEPDTALVLNLQGDLVEEYTIGPREAAVAEALGEQRFETRLRDVLAVMDHATRDPQITRAVLVLDEMGSGGQASLREIAAALAKFKAAGKPVVAWGEGFSQPQYYLAAQANEVYMHPGGMLTVHGMGGTRTYYKNLLDKLGVRINTFQAGRYKSFAEPFTRTGPTPEAREADSYLLNGLWALWTSDVERARGLTTGTINAVLEDLPQRLAAANGDLAQLAAKEKLVDGLKTREELRRGLLDAGAPPSDDDEETFRQISVYSYLRHVRQPLTGDAVGVIVAQGEIVGGDARQGRVGSTSTAELIQRARQDDRIKAVVMRIDSPGGMVQPSDLIREQLDLTRKAGKPVVVSMGDVAASGGYWIAMGGDEVLADAATITGSIGVFGIIPTFEGTADKLGVTTDSVATTWLGTATDLTKPLDKRLEQVVSQMIGNNYREFLALVAERRKSTPDKINEVAQGRVWTGAQARDRGLVDGLGGIDDAVKSAARRASLGDSYRVEYIEHEPRGLNRYLSLLFGRVAAFARSGLGWESAAQALLGASPAQVRRELEMLATARRQPLTAFSYCFCEVRQSP
ncbi:MAG TPA: signal peptide peptidase SppA [Burkholderiaceae bacterium]|nr:signal peptide peptidase SppA [Burkholderiaceae bacterium]